MKNIHIIPTDKPSRLLYSKTESSYEFVLKQTPSKCNDGLLSGQKNIYITSDEEIKEGDWYYLPKENKIAKCPKILKLHSVTPEWTQKIILTTDQDLIKDGIQAIDDEFLEWFVKNPSCEKVEVESFCKNGNNCPSQGAYDKQYLCDVGYKIIIPKEEPKQEWTPTQGEQVWIKVFSNWSSGTYIGYDRTKHIHLVRENEEGGGNLLSSSKILPYKLMPNEPKQETLEEAAERIAMMKDWDFESSEGNGYYDYVEGFIDGAKWQAEIMYSEEELKEICVKYHNRMCLYGNAKTQIWFEQIKKK